MKIGIVQMASTNDPWANLLSFSAFLKEAKYFQVQLLCFPENVFYRGPFNFKSPQEWPIAFDFKRDADVENSAKNLFRTSEQMAFQDEVENLLIEFDLNVAIGSCWEVSGRSDRYFNTQAMWVNGQWHSIYRKIHLFRYCSERISYDERAQVTAGDTVVSTDVEGVRVGSSICYDLRFPELYRQLVLDQSCELLLVPAAFTKSTGERHWLKLLCARAIENQAYVLAPAQWGEHKNESQQSCSCYGHSAVVDPDGSMLWCAAGIGDDLGFVDLNLPLLKQIRKQIPVLSDSILRL